MDFQDGSHSGHNRLPIGTILAIFLSTSMCFLPSFLVQKKQKIDFQDGSHLGFSIGMIIANFDLQVTPRLPTKFKVNWPFGSGAEAKNRFSKWRPRRPLRFPIRTILTLFDLHVTRMLPTNFQVNWPFGSAIREEAKNRFSRWPQRWPSWISDRDVFSYF